MYIPFARTTAAAWAVLAAAVIAVPALAAPPDIYIPNSARAVLPVAVTV